MPGIATETEGIRKFCKIYNQCHGSMLRNMLSELHSSNTLVGFSLDSRTGFTHMLLFSPQIRLFKNFF
ncbi:hypothetical protein ACSQ67_002085 [Phaseolus vulgaris]